MSSRKAELKEAGVIKSGNPKANLYDMRQKSKKKERGYDLGVIGGVGASAGLGIASIGAARRSMSAVRRFRAAGEKAQTLRNAQSKVKGREVARRIPSGPRGPHPFQELQGEGRKALKDIERNRKLSRVTGYGTLGALGGAGASQVASVNEGRKRKERQDIISSPRLYGVNLTDGMKPPKKARK